MQAEFEHPIVISRRNKIWIYSEIREIYEEMMDWKMPTTKYIMSQQDYEDICKFSKE